MLPQSENKAQAEDRRLSQFLTERDVGEGDDPAVPRSVGDVF